MNGSELRKEGFKVRQDVTLKLNGKYFKGKITLLNENHMKVLTKDGEATIDFNS